MHTFVSTPRRYGRAAAALLVVAATNVALATPVGAVSASTQKFFGFSDNNGAGNSFSQPASCDISGLLKQNDSINAQISQIDSESQAKIAEINQEIKDAQSGDSATLQQLQDEENTTLQSANAQVQALHNQQEDVKKQTEGPSDQCKRDTVLQAVSQMQALQSALNGTLNSTLDKVDAVVAEINTLTPKLSSAGVNGNDVATVKSDIASVQSDSTALRGYLAAMGTQAAAFIASAQADPLGTYDTMQTNHSTLSGSTSSGASNAADDLVTNFTNLVNLFDRVTGSTEGQ